ncbi:uncharacterized protein LOC116674505 [Etheostoma spectabile]|uniref:uncharacterized protein LOC116674505 n=1 Tax=Etheostoma spectabile TaxID=54343 RepID=UPI0013AF543F|nr:uncharacterized protein LOC116674505 [Etheostoma spectabile]
MCTPGLRSGTTVDYKNNHNQRQNPSTSFSNSLSRFTASHAGGQFQPGYHQVDFPPLSHDKDKDAENKPDMSLLQKRCLEKNAVGLKSFDVSPGKMFLPVQSIWCIVLTLCMSVCGLEIPKYEVICSKGLSDCTIMSHGHVTVAEDNNAVYVQNLTPSIKLCCKDSAPCTLCLMIDIEINIHLDKVSEDEGSGYEEEDYSEETERNSKASVTVCYSVPTMPTCKKGSSSAEFQLCS